jgi:CheY-like chemotaxis protein
MRPSLVMLDLELPRLDDHTVGSQLRASCGDALPIVVTATGQATEAADGINPWAGTVAELFWQLPGMTGLAVSSGDAG